MALEMVNDFSKRKASGIRTCLRAEFLFSDDAFGPVKVLQLFAAIGRLPEEFNVRRGEDTNEWIVSLSIEQCSSVERVLAKINSMPALLASEFSSSQQDLSAAGGSQFN